MPAILRNGNLSAPGGYRKGAGRKPDEFKRWLKKLVHSPKGRKRFEKIIQDAEDAETLVTQQGVEVPTRAKADTYLRALELGYSYERGKPVAIGALQDENGEVMGVVILPAQIHGKEGKVE